MPGTPVTLVAWTTAPVSNGIENVEQIIVGQLSLESHTRDSGTESKNGLMHKLEVELLVLGDRSALEYKFIDGGSKGAAYQACAMFSKPIRRRSIAKEYLLLTLHIAMSHIRVGSQVDGTSPGP